MEKIWKGAFAPGFTKGVVDAWFIPDGEVEGYGDVDEADAREEIRIPPINEARPNTHLQYYGDPSDITGDLYVQFHNMGPYVWTTTLADYIAFAEAGFSTSWLWNNLPLSPGRR